MSFWHESSGNTTYGRVSFIVGTLACVLPIVIFGIRFPTLPTLEKNVLTGIFAVSMGLSLFIGHKRPYLGLVVFPAFFFLLMSGACAYLRWR